MGYKRGERMALTAALTPRQKRQMLKELSEIQDEVEAVEDKRNKLIASVWAKGLPLAALQGSIGLGYETIRKILKGQGLDIDPE